MERPRLIPERSVIRRGAFAELAGHVVEAVAAARYVVVVDGTVWPLYGEPATAALRAVGLRAEGLVFPAGEASKGLDAWARLTDEIAALGAGRDACVVAVGGGVTLDLAGFVAATWMRGVPWIAVPTSLLAMIDAAWGGKTGVDIAAGKNLVGAFHPPSALIADPALLATLPAAELRQGLAEAVKHGAIADADHVAWLERESAQILSLVPRTIDAMVAHSAGIKREFVEQDPLEAGARKALNFGHTVGHALEALSGYALAHGSAVAAGMVGEAWLGERAGVTQAGTAQALARALAAFGLPALPPPALRDPAGVVRRATSDKKNRQGRTRYALPSRLGAMARDEAGDWSVHVPDGTVLAALEELWTSDGTGVGISADTKTV